MKLKTINDLDVENTENFPKPKSVLTVVRSAVPEQQIWAMIAEANYIFGMFLLDMIMIQLNN